MVSPDTRSRRISWPLILLTTSSLLRRLPRLFAFTLSTRNDSDVVYPNVGDPLHIYSKRVSLFSGHTLHGFHDIAQKKIIALEIDFALEWNRPA